MREVFWKVKEISYGVVLHPYVLDDMRSWKLLKLIQRQAQKWKLQENKFMLYVFQVPGRVSTDQNDRYWSSMNEIQVSFNGMEHLYMWM